VRGGFLPFITVLVVVAVIAAVRGDWLLAAVFAGIAGAGVRLHVITDKRRRDR
jgi:hypothetical protein